MQFLYIISDKGKFYKNIYIFSFLQVNNTTEKLQPILLSQI